MPSFAALAGYPAAAANREGSVMGANPRRTARDESTGSRFYIRTAEDLRAMPEEALRNRIRWIRMMLSPDAGGMDYIRSRERAIALAERRQLENEYTRREDDRRRALNPQPTRRKDP